MTVRLEIAFQYMFRVTSSGFRVFESSFMTTRNMKPDTRNSIPQRSGSALAADAHMNNAGLDCPLSDKLVRPSIPSGHRMNSVL